MFSNNTKQKCVATVLCTKIPVYHKFWDYGIMVFEIVLKMPSIFLVLVSPESSDDKNIELAGQLTAWLL